MYTEKWNPRKESVTSISRLRTVLPGEKSSRKAPRPCSWHRDHRCPSGWGRRHNNHFRSLSFTCSKLLLCSLFASCARSLIPQPSHPRTVRVSRTSASARRAGRGRLQQHRSHRHGPGRLPSPSPRSSPAALARLVPGEHDWKQLD